MNTYDNATASEQNASVEQIKPGTYVRKVNKDGSAQSKVYIRGEYDRNSKRYSLQDAEDINREVWVKKGTVLAIGFTY